MFNVEEQVEINGIEIGVVENGMPDLNGSGLARVCGPNCKALNRLGSDWTGEHAKPRGRKILEHLEKASVKGDALFLPSEHYGVAVNAYTEPVCFAILEYYAFAVDEPRTQAVQAFRTLAKTASSIMP